MLLKKTICLIIPARNEEKGLPAVLSNVPDFIDRVIVVDNGSTDRTAQAAQQCGATVLYEPRPGYGRACLKGISFLAKTLPDIVAFADADGSDDLHFLKSLILPLAEDKADFALAARTLPQPGAMSFPQVTGNRLAVGLIKIFWKHSFKDLGPMRAIGFKPLLDLRMADPNYGWTVEMQVKAVKAGFRISEFPTIYRKRTIGRSKVSRSFSGVIKAGTKILWVIFREALFYLTSRFFEPETQKGGPSRLKRE